MSTSEIFLIAMLIIFTAPYLIWRLGRTEYFAPLVVVQIITGILLGPGVLGALFPDYYKFVFNAPVIQSLNAIAQWAVMLFVWIAGIELDLKKAWEHRYESGVTAGLALGVPLLFGSVAAVGMLMYPGWIGPKALTWQFVLGIGMACAVTALPILILLMEKIQILRQPIGQRILRYASVDDIAIWGVLTLILMDWERVGKQAGFLVVFALASAAFRWLMVRIPEKDRWYAGLIWLAACGLGADWCGLHYMVGAFIAGAVMDSDWFDQKQMDWLRHNVLLVMMPVFFLSTGLRTNWQVGGGAVFVVAAVLLVASVSGKLIGTHIAGKILRWQPGEGSLIGWLLQTKALIMIIFSNVLLDKAIITNEAFTALLLMAVASTMLTVPVVSPKLARMKEIVFRSK
ncbi:cation:proton antiporter [Variovorax sp. PAMC 28711]|uniref:cation:proton antiporter n=1 Tax=Variovorax sp. PAMC 28711 TaxID=1795631 RepID=UPI00078EDF05|nr:cation:proton antiporter [Variovorax sp. PAMC 28711]AMM26435.1 sodium:proton exchanger [Variovorax sp. PAMC 28711]